MAESDTALRALEERVAKLEALSHGHVQQQKADKKICWYCVHWQCPSWFDEKSHGGKSGCCGFCAIHLDRHEATDTCELWSQELAQERAVGHCATNETLRAAARELAEAVKAWPFHGDWRAWADTLSSGWISRGYRIADALDRVDALLAGETPTPTLLPPDNDPRVVAMADELALLRKLEEAVLEVDAAPQWRYRASIYHDLVVVSPSEQQAIADILDALDKAREAKP